MGRTMVSTSIMMVYIMLVTVIAGTAAMFPSQGYQHSFDATQSDKEMLDLLTHKNRYDKRTKPPQQQINVNVSVMLLSLSSPDESSLIPARLRFIPPCTDLETRCILCKARHLQGYPPHRGLPQDFPKRDNFLHHEAPPGAQLRGRSPNISFRLSYV